MTVYVVVSIISIILAWVGKKHIISFQKKYVYILSGLPVVLNAGFRYMVGIDYKGYVDDFYRFMANQRGWEEPVYSLIEHIIIFLGGNEQWVFMAFAILFVVPIYKQIYDDSPIPVLSIFLLFSTRYYFAYLNITRQLCAAAILLFSVRYIERKNLKGYLLCIMIAVGLHTSSIVFLPMYFWANVKLGLKKIVSISLILLVMSDIIRPLMVHVFSATRYSFYLNTDYFYAGSNYFNILVQASPVVLAYFYYSNNKKFQTYFNMQLIACWVMMFSGTLPLFDRLRFYFSSATIILIPLSINNIHKVWVKRLITAIIIILYGIYVYYGIAIKNEYGVIPYRTFFNN